MAFTQSSFAAVPQLVKLLTAPVTEIAATAAVDRTITGIVGLVPDMVPVITYPALDAGLVISNCWCTTAGSLVIRFYNWTASPITPTAATIKLMCF